MPKTDSTNDQVRAIEERAIALEPGKVYCITTERIMGGEDLLAVKKHFENVLQQTGIKLILLPPGFNLVTGSYELQELVIDGEPVELVVDPRRA